MSRRHEDKTLWVSHRAAFAWGVMAGMLFMASGVSVAVAIVLLGRIV